MDITIITLISISSCLIVVSCAKLIYVTFDVCCKKREFYPEPEEVPATYVTEWK